MTGLLIAVRELLKGNSYLSSMVARDTVDFMLRQGKELREEAERLTSRQREVLQILAEGKCMKEAASALRISTRTVAFHKYKIMEVLNADSDSDLVRYAVKHHLVAA